METSKINQQEFINETIEKIRMFLPEDQNEILNSIRNCIRDYQEKDILILEQKLEYLKKQYEYFNLPQSK